jgi:hypothetical protein
MRTIPQALRRLVFLLTLAASFAAGHASANIMYSFSGATFSDGGTLTGTFTTNDARNSLVTFDVTTSGGSLMGFHYTPATAISFSSLPAILVLETSTLTHLIQVTFSGLTAAGAPITIGALASFEQDPSGTHRQIVAGAAVASTTSVPEPSTLALVSISVLGLLGFVRRRPRT